MSDDLERIEVYDDDPRMLTERDRLQLLEAFASDGMLRAEHMNAIIGEVLSLRARIAELEMRR